MNTKNQITKNISVQDGGWCFGLTACKLWVFGDVTFCSASIYSLIAISADRFYAVFYPFDYINKRSKTITNIKILVAWIVGVIIASPMFINSPGFNEWDIDDTSILDNHSGGCNPPVKYSYFKINYN